MYIYNQSPQAKRYRRAATEAAANALRAQRASEPNAIARLLLVDPHPHPHLDQVARALLVPVSSSSTLHQVFSRPASTSSLPFLL